MFAQLHSIQSDKPNPIQRLITLSPVTANGDYHLILTLQSAGDLKPGMRVWLRIATEQGEAVAPGVLGRIESDGFHHICHLHSPFHPLTKGLASTAWTDSTVSEITQAIFDANGCLLQVACSQSLTVPYVTQYRESAWHFLQRFWQQYGVVATVCADTTGQIVLRDGLLPGQAHQLLWLRDRGQGRNDAYYFEPREQLMLLPQVFAASHTTLATGGRWQGQCQGGRGYGQVYAPLPDETALAVVRHAEDSRRVCYRMKTNVPTITLGDSLQLSPNPFAAAALRVVAIEHTLTHTGAYYNEVLAIDASQTYAPNCRAQPLPARLLLGRVEGDSAGNSVDARGLYRTQIFEMGDTMTPPLPKTQGFTRENGGMHFPLAPATEVMLGFVNDLPCQPVILGATFSEEQASPVTSANAQQGILRTKQGGGCLFDLATRTLTLSTCYQKQSVRLSAEDGIYLLAQAGDVSMTSAEHILLYSRGAQTHRAAAYDLQGDSGVRMLSEEGAVQYKVMGSLFHLSGAQLHYAAKDTLSLHSSDRLYMQAQAGVSVQCETLTCQAASEMTLQSDSGTCLQTGDGTITLSVGNAAITLSADTVTLRAPRVALAGVLVTDGGRFEWC